MSELLYKKKSLRFSGCGLSKAVRLKEHSENRKSSRSEILNARRNICYDVDDSLISEPEPPKEKAAAVKIVSKPLSRLEQLKKWKEEKELKRKIELENKRKAPFVVGKAKPAVGSSVMNPSTLLGGKNTSRIISFKNISSLSILKSNNRVTPKVNLPASLAKPLAKNVNLSAQSVAKPLTKNVTVSSVSQKGKPQSTLPALSATAKDKPPMTAGIPKTFVSRIPSRNLPQVNQGTKTVDSRIPACKPSIQLKKNVKENQPVAKTDGKRNLPDRIGKIDGKGIGVTSLAFKSEKRNLDLKFTKPIPGMLPKPVTGKNTFKKVVENSKITAERKVEPKRKSFAPENFNFKFATKLPVLDLDLSVFEGIDFSRKTSTPIRETPVPSPEIARINSETGSKRLLSDISERIDENVNQNKNSVTEVDINKNTITEVDINKNIITDLDSNKNTDTVSVANNFDDEQKKNEEENKSNDEEENKSINAITETETDITDGKEVPYVSSDFREEGIETENVISEGIGESEKCIATSSEPEKNELISADENKTEIGDKNITRRSKVLGKNSKVLEEINVTELENLSDVKPDEPLRNPRLFSIKEELECSSLDATPISNPSRLRRSLRLAKLAQNETPVKVENPGASTNHTDLTEAFEQLQMVSKMSSEEDLEPQLPTKEMKPKKVSLLYTPPSSRYSLRKSVRGDLISFS